MESLMADKEEGGSIVYGGGNFDAMPEGCIAAIVAFTTPRDACRLAVVSKDFWSASESDIVWEQFLPSDCELIMARSDGGEALEEQIRSKKQLYMHLANCPLLVDGAAKSFWVEKSCGKKCWMLCARSLSITWTCTPRYWKYTSIPESRFPQVAELITVCWLEIIGKINTSMLSPETRYAAYLVFKMKDNAYGFRHVNVSVGVGVGGPKTETQVYLTSRSQRRRLPSRLPLGDTRVSRQEADRYPKPRADGWEEVKIGEFFTHVDEEDEIHLQVFECGNWKGGLIVEGIEVRPVEQD